MNLSPMGKQSHWNQLYYSHHSILFTSNMLILMDIWQFMVSNLNCNVQSDPAILWWYNITLWLQLGALEAQWQPVSLTFWSRTRWAGGLVAAIWLFSSTLQPVRGQVLAARTEDVVERGREASNVSRDVGKHFWRCLVIISDLETD